MKSISEFCVACDKIEDLEGLFITCETAGLVWNKFTSLLKKIIPGEALARTKALLLRDFQTKSPKRATTLASYLMKMVPYKLWTTRCARLFDKKQVSAQDTIDDSTKGGLTQFGELFTMIPCAPKDFKKHQ